MLGPTAVGKTALCVSLAQEWKTEVISCDSRQFYKDIQIGTARPPLDEQAGIPHHFLGFLDLDQEYTAGQFERDVLTLCEEKFKTHDKLIMTGGSGLFIRAVVEGLDDIPSDMAIRQKLNDRVGTEGLSALRDELKALDPVTYDRIDLHNPQRLIRALEVCLATGRPYSSFLRKERAPRPFDIVLIGLRREKVDLHRRIEMRAQEMIHHGWIEECRSVMHLRHLNSLNTVGYKEVFRHLDGEMRLEECLDEVKLRTRQMAKRQMTFFRKLDGVHWIDLPTRDAVSEVFAELKKATQVDSDVDK